MVGGSGTYVRGGGFFEASRLAATSPLGNMARMARRHVLPLLLVVAWMVVFVVVLLADDSLPLEHSDTTRYMAPAIAFLRNALLDGHFPLWNPYQLAGAPFLALHSPGATYPFVLAFALFPAHVAVTIHTAVHLVVAGALTYGFARSIGVATSGSLGAALTFMGAVNIVDAAHGNTTYFSTLAWVPGVLWGVRSVVIEPTVRRGVLFAAATAMCFLGGYSQGFLLTVQAGLVYALFVLATEGRPGTRVRAFAILAGAGALAIGLVAVQLLPSVEHARSAARNLGGLSLRQASLYSLHLEPIVQALLGRGQALSLPGLVTPLALLALFHPSTRRHAWFFLAMLLVTLEFMRGAGGFVYPVYFNLPMGSVFRIPIRIGFLTDLAAAMLVGIGIATIVSWLGRWPRAAGIAAAVLVVGVGTDQLIRNAPRVAFLPIVEPSLIYGPPDLVEASEAWGKDRFFISGSTVEKTVGQVHGRFMAGAYEPLLPGIYGRFFGIPNRMIWHGQLYIRPAPRARRNRPRSITQTPHLLDLMSVRYYADLGPARSRGIADIVESPAERHGAIRIHERPSAVPRVYVVHDMIEVDSSAAALEKVRNGRFDPRRIVVVESNGGPLPPLAPAPADAVESAEFEAYEPNRVVVRAECASDCLLVLTDLHDPGWRVTVDGDETPMLRVNGIFRGVPLHAGEHVVEYRYSPTSIRIGLALSAVSALIVLAAAFFGGPGRPDSGVP